MVASGSVNLREGLSPKGKESEIVNGNNIETAEPRSISMDEESPDPQPDNDDSGDSSSGKKV